MNYINKLIFLTFFCFLTLALSSQTQNIRDSSVVKQNHELKNNFTYFGTVLDSVTNKTLPFAAVFLLDNQSKLIISGSANDKGFFRINSRKASSSIKVTFLGYKDKVFKLPAQTSNLGELRLVPEGKLLKETIVSAMTVDNKVDRSSYLITDKMRKQASNAQELIDQIHGVRYDKLTNTIRVGTESSVLLLVDDVKQSEEYIKNLPPNRISRIEVITEPTGQYLSEGYGAIINFILKKDYSGYDVNIQNMSLTSFAKYNGNDWLIQEQPSLGITYTKDKINVFANYMYDRNKMNTPVWKSQTYTDLFDITPADNSINQYNDLSNYVDGGINYQLSPKHALSYQMDYTYRKMNDETNLRYRSTDIENNTQTSTTSLSQDKTQDKNYVGTVFYKGEIGEKINLYADFTYNYYSNNIQNNFSQGADYFQENLYNERKKYTELNVNGEYTFNPKMTLSAGYVNVWRKYDSKNTDGTSLLDYTERRNQLFAYLQYIGNDKFSVKIGSALEYVKVNSEDNSNFWNIQPYLQLNYKINDKANFNLSYLTNSYYPSLYQLSTLTTAIDSMMMQTGNPNLKSAVRNTISAKLTLWDRLTIRPMLKLTPNRISEIYTYNNNNYYSTFANISLKQHILQVIYDQPLGAYFKLNTMLACFYDKISYKGIKNSYRGWILESEMKYFNPKWNFGTQLGYYKDVDKSALLQGYQMVNVDYWIISVQKQFLNKRASLMISYFPPLEWGVRDKSDKVINTQFYTERYTQSFKPYRNMLMVKYSLRFNSGSPRKLDKESSVENEERAKREVGF